MATKSTIETSGVGTRRARPFIFPASSGNVSVAATAAPVVVGIMLKAAALALLRSLCCMSSSRWSLVTAWVVVISPALMPNLSLSTLATGDTQFVVHDAREIMWWFWGTARIL